MIVAAMGVSQGWVAGLAHAATGGLIAAVWQGVVLSLLVALGLRLLPKTPAAVRFAIWFGVFVVVAALPSAGLLHRNGTAGSNGHTAWLMLDERWCVMVAAVWGVASLVRAVTLLLAVLRVRALWKRAAPLAFADAGAVDAIGQAGSRRAELCVSDEVDRPTVIGFFSPKILIPAWLVEKLTTSELEQIMLHEAGHLSRADDWMNLLQKIALVVFPLNPALAWVERRLCFERELACDERVLETTGAPKAYAACLASLAEHRLGRRGLALALALGALGRDSELGRRVRRILGRGERMRPVQAKLVLGGAMLGLLAAAAGLERCPSVVGFASSADGAAVASEAVRSDFGMRDAYRYQAVVFHSQGFRASVVGSQAARIGVLRATPSAVRTGRPIRRLAQPIAAPTAAGKALLQASLTEPADASDRLGETGGERSQPVQGQQVSASDTAFNDGELQNVKFEDVGARAEGSPAVQWVVVTSWRGDDGSRMVLTTLRTASPDGSTATNAIPQQNQVHPYAAVPVRDGWLLIQL